jgi:hypothetical protein
MTTTIKHKRSSVAGNAPDAADIETGELAINFPDAALYTKDGSGNIVELSITDAIKEPVKNVSGGSLSVGTVVYQSGTAGNSAEVQAASNSSASTMPALGIITSTLADEAEGYIVLIGKINHINTSSFNEGDTLYVGASGTLTTTVPSGEGALIQNIGKVLKVHASNGSIMVTGAGRTNATPNLNDGNIFIGNSSNQATTGSLDTLVGAEGYVKLGTTSTTALAGNTSIPSALTDLSITDGTNGQVLTTDGSGSFTFGDGGINTTLTTYNFTATSNQTTFSGADSNGNTLGYATGNLIVSVNGVVHRNGVEYTATNGTSVVFSSGLETSDEVSIVTFSVIDLTNIDYSNVNNTPSLATVATSGSYSDLSGTPSLSTVATSGSYTNLSNTPLAYDSVGSYLLGYVNGPSNSGPGDFLPGQTLAGSFIRPAGIRLGADPTSEFNSDDEAAGGINAVTYRGDYVPSGTWRVMGNLDRGDNQTANWARFTLFVRIS